MKLPNVFYTETQDFGLMTRYCIIIPRKPSEIPGSVDMDLIRRAGQSEMDGPNRKVTYLLSNNDIFHAAVEMLKRCGWKLIEKPIS